MKRLFDFYDLAGLSRHCIEQSRKRIPFFRDLSDLEIRNRVGQAIRCADSLGLVFDNPKKEGQYLVYAQFHERDFWFVVGHNHTRRDGKWLAVTLFVHKDKHAFAEYFEKVESILQEDQHSVA